MTKQTFSTADLAGAERADERRADEEPRVGDERAADPRDDAPVGETRLADDTDAQPRTRGLGGADDRPAGTADVAAGADDGPQLLERDDDAEFQRLWQEIQTGFVDSPRETVERADELVASVMKRLAEGFAAERERLEGQWGRGEDVSTEDLRLTLQRYRSFFQRLLSA
jgi:hypothetical protein